MYSLTLFYCSDYKVIACPETTLNHYHKVAGFIKNSEEEKRLQLDWKFASYFPRR